MIALRGINVNTSEFNKISLREGWRLILNPRHYREQVGFVFVAEAICIFAEIITRLSGQEASLLTSLYSGIAYGDIDACIPKSLADEVTALLAEIRYVFEHVDCSGADPQIAFDFVEFVFVNVNREDLIMEKLNCNVEQAKALTYFCKVLFPEEVL